MINSLNFKIIQYNNTAQNRSVEFKGMSKAQEYKTTFDYLSAQILKSNGKKYDIDGSQLSAKHIVNAVIKLFSDNKIFRLTKKANQNKIAWKPYIGEEVKMVCVDKINEARTKRLNEWKSLLECTPDNNEQDTVSKNLAAIIMNNPSLKLVIWHSINSELTESNRHIPVPLDKNALYETIKDFTVIYPKSRESICAQLHFLDLYTHKLRDNLLEELGYAGKKRVWVKIPSLKKDPENQEKNIRNLEILSDKNWCTRSSVDKAADALRDGNFYIYLEKDDKKQWQSLVGMTTYRGKIDQIQGRENNNLIPIDQLENIKNFLNGYDDKGNKIGPALKFSSTLNDEKPGAFEQILIAEKLVKPDEKTGKTLEQAIKMKNSQLILRILNYDVKTLDDDTLEISTYTPRLMVQSTPGIVMPYSYCAISEDFLLSKVSVINGDFNLWHKKNEYHSTITKFPPKLKKVTGKITCSSKLYEKFKDDMLRVVDNDTKRIIVKN